MKRVLTTFVLIGMLTALFATIASAQGYQKGKTYLGPTIGYGWGLGFGAGGEYGVTENIAVGGEFSYTGFTNSFGGFGYTYEWKYTLIGFLAAGSYHFSPGAQFDPYVRAGLGYFNWDATYTDSQGSTSTSLFGAAYTSGIGFAGQVGARYHFSGQMSGRAALGWPFIISAGVDFTL